MSKQKEKRGRRKAREDLERRIVAASAEIIDAEVALVEAKKDLDDLVAQWREVCDEAIGL